jgi:hypothetical protein
VKKGGEYSMDYRICINVGAGRSRRNSWRGESLRCIGSCGHGLRDMLGIVKSESSSIVMIGGWREDTIDVEAADRSIR